MQAKIFLVCALLVVVLASETLANSERKSCRRNSQCRTKCCVDNKCADSINWCPCEKTSEQCDENEKCVSQQVQCIKAPCYPVADCVPK